MGNIKGEWQKGSGIRDGGVSKHWLGWMSASGRTLVGGRSRLRGGTQVGAGGGGGGGGGTQVGGWYRPKFYYRTFQVDFFL